MKRLFALIGLILFLFSGCAPAQPPAEIAATTLPVYEFTTRLCAGTDITVTRLVTESVSCLHDYSLNVRQVRAAEAAQIIVISGAGLESTLEDLFRGDARIVDSSRSVPLRECSDAHGHGEESHGHHHEADSHIWLSPENARTMARNICLGLCEEYPAYTEAFSRNLEGLIADLDALESYGKETLSGLHCREIITFHDGFGYFADFFGLEILEAVEEESGSEASAQELKHLITLVRDHRLPAIFIETNGSVSAAEVIARETGAKVCTLDMAMGGDSYFDAMYHNINTLKEALG